MLKKALFAATALFALAGAAHAADLKEFRIGILGGENETDRLRNYACLADHLKQEFGFEKVSLFPAADYDGVIQESARWHARLRRTRRLRLRRRLHQGAEGCHADPDDAAEGRLDGLLFDRPRPEVLRHQEHQGRQGQEARLRRSGFHLGLPRSADADPEGHRRTERQVLRLDPVQRRPREQPSRCL